jgi:integrase
MGRVYNFSAGPAVLPESVLQEAAAEMLDYQGCGMGVNEMSHRSKVFQGIIDEAEADVDVEETYIIGGVDGSPSSPPSIGFQWARFAKKNALVGASGKRLKFHDLRDCYGTSLLGAGVDVTTAASLMGHGDGGATLLKYYSTALDSNKRLAAQKLSKALGDGSGD